jgi:hypothetical protein
MSRDFGLDVERVAPAEAPWKALQRRVSGRYPVDPFGLDPQLCDFVAPLVRAVVRVDIEHAERIPAVGGAVLVSNRGLGVGEPTALSVAVRDAVGRRLRIVGAPNLAFANGALRRLGAIAASAEDVSSALHSGHLVAAPLSPTWLRTGAGTPPLELVQVMMEFPVVPVAVRAAGPLGTPTSWHVNVGTPLRVDHTYSLGDPLGAAELGETVRVAVGKLLSGDDVTDEVLDAAAW